ncbi:hypothetical protein [Thalassobacillus sp. CUG 92003]|uniref:hypothetical protein n=1 Tax=Thalassobacillus sp. CUG 92003 TaxID=2736641 RepID=UPI0015E6AF0A|nr:hypothetical protein [Thalassobacillus sp. CUG 92003]
MKSALIGCLSALTLMLTAGCNGEEEAESEHEELEAEIEEEVDYEVTIPTFEDYQMHSTILQTRPQSDLTQVKIGYNLPDDESSSLSEDAKSRLEEQENQTVLRGNPEDESRLIVTITPGEPGLMDAETTQVDGTEVTFKEQPSQGGTYAVSFEETSYALRTMFSEKMKQEEALDKMENLISQVQD